VTDPIEKDRQAVQPGDPNERSNNRDSAGPEEQPPGRRDRPDRRKRPTPMFSKYTFIGRRRQNRRTTDPRIRYYIDWISGGYLKALIAILLLITIDTFSTLHIISHGGGEANPLMRTMIDHGPVWFALLKILSALLGFVLLALHRFFPIARALVKVLIAAYGGIVAFHVFLLFQIHG